MSSATADFSELAESNIYKRIKDDNDPKAWAIFKVDDNEKSKVRIVMSGRGGLTKMHKYLKDDEMAFGVFRAFAIEAGVKQPKIFFFTWAGSKANLKRKVAANAIKTGVLEYFSPVHCSAQISSLAEISEEEICKRLDSSRGSHKPQGYEFGTGNDADEEDDERDARLAEERRIVEEAARLAKEEADRLAAAEAARLAELERIRLEEEAAAAEAARVAAVEAARVAEETRIREEEERRVAEEAARVAAELAAEQAAKEAEEARIEEEKRRVIEEQERKIRMLPTYQTHNRKRFEASPDVAGYDFSALTSEYVLEELANVESQTAWVLCNVAEDAAKTIKIVGRGSGNIDEILPLLADDDIMYGCIRVTAVDRKGTRVSVRARLVYFIWNGNVISSKTRFRNSGVIRAMAAYFIGTSLELKLNGDKSELNPTYITAALMKAAAASEYKFGVYDKLVQADEYIKQVDDAKSEANKTSQRHSELSSEYTARLGAKLAAERAESEARSALELAKQASQAEAGRKERDLKDAQEKLSTARAAADVISKSRGPEAEKGKTTSFNAPRSFIPKAGESIAPAASNAAPTQSFSKAKAAPESPSKEVAAEPAPAPAPVAAPAPAPEPAAAPVAAPAPAAKDEDEDDDDEDEKPAAAPAPAPEPAAAPVAAPAPAAKDEDDDDEDEKPAAAPAPAPEPAAAPVAAPAPAAKDEDEDDDDEDEKPAAAPAPAPEPAAAPVAAPPAAKKAADSDSDSDDEDEKPKAAPAPAPKAAPAPAPAPAAAKKAADSDSDSDSEDDKPKAKPAPAPAPKPAAAAPKAAAKKDSSDSDSDSDSSSDSSSDSD